MGMGMGFAEALAGDGLDNLFSSSKCKQAEGE
jgi:hypothetical protein